MSTEQKNKGKIVWQDLTVPNAEEVKDFYEAVVGWGSTAQSMGDYDDYNIQPNPQAAYEQTFAGICHARGSNAKIPAQWMIYIQVEDVHASIEACLNRGGAVLDGPRKMGKSDFCVIKDPAGAVCALITEAKEEA